MGLVGAVMPLRHGWGVELRYLRHFIAVAEERSITSAAARLRVAQPALSRQLRALEDEIGSPLMERNSRGVMLTQAGLAFAEDAQRILAAVEVAVSAARARSRGRKAISALATPRLRPRNHGCRWSELTPAATRATAQKGVSPTGSAAYDYRGRRLYELLRPASGKDESPRRSG